MTAVLDIEGAYRRCEQITAAQARNFSYGIRLLPTEKRRALSAVYAFARRVDDIGDSAEPAAQRLAGLAEVRARLHALDRPGDDQVLLALEHAARTFELPLSAFDELIDGCEADVRGSSYDTFEQLHGYCRCVAGSIGRLSLAVFGVDDRAVADPIADALGIALQLTNILRDIVEDRRNGRIYLPSEDLAQFGCTLTLNTMTLNTSTLNTMTTNSAGEFVDDHDSLLALIEFEAARAQDWYAEGLALLPMLDRRSRACCAAMAGIYHRLLGRIMLRPWRVLEGRISLPDWEKVAVAGRALAGATP